MARKMKRLRTQCEPRGPSDDDMPGSSEVQRSSTKKNKNKAKMIQILVKFKDEMTSEMRKLLENHIESNNSQSIMLCKNLEKLAQTLEKLNESHNDLRNQLELHTTTPRSQWIQERPPRYRLIFRSEVIDKIEKGKSIEIHVGLVDVNNGQTVKIGPLASATVELVVIDAKFNENDNQYNWSREDFVSNIKKAPQGNSTTINVDQSVKSIVSNGRFNLENGDKRHSDCTIFSNSGNKKVRFGVMVVSPTQERVLEGLSNPFFVRGHDRPNRRQARVDNGSQEQNGPEANMQNLSCPNFTQADGNGSVVTPVLGGQYQPQFQRNTPALYTEPAIIQQYQIPHRSMLAQAPNSQTVVNGNQEQNDPMQDHSCTNLTQADGNGSFITPMLGGQLQPLFQRNTSVLSTEPTTRQQHQVLHRSILAQASNKRTVQASVDTGNQEQNGPMSNMRNPSCLNSTQADGNGSIETPIFGGHHLQPSFEKNTTVLSTEPSASQQHQVPHWSMLAQASNNPTGMNAIGQTLPLFIGNTDIAYTEPSASQVQQAWIPENQDHWPTLLTHQPLNSGTGTPFHTNQIAFPVRLVLDMPSVMPSKHCFNLLDQFTPLDSWQPEVFTNCGLPATCLMQEHFGSLTTMPKEVVQTRRGRGVLIEPLEPDDSDEGPPEKRKLHSKYQLQFLNKVCDTYYTRDQVKADDGNLLMVALFDENNTKITSGPLSSACVEVVALHGDFNLDGQDYWTSEEFNRSVLRSIPGEASSISVLLGGDLIFFLSDGEACLHDAFFQRTSICARTGMFKMGVMLASAQDERVQEGISEPFRVMDNHVKELNAKDGPTQGFNPAAATLQLPRNTVTEAIQQQQSSRISHVKARSAPCKSILPDLKKSFEWNETHLDLQKKDLTTETDANGSTILHFAADKLSSICRQVLEANPNALYIPDNAGLFPIHIAASVGASSNVDMFVQRCPGSACLCDPKGRTFLHVAVRNGKTNVIRSACRNLSLSWIMNMVDIDGNTALHLAVRAGSLEMFCPLLGNPQVNLNLPNSRGVTPLDIAQYKFPKGGLHYIQNSKVQIQRALRIAGAVEGASCQDHLMEVEDDRTVRVKDGGSKKMEVLKDSTEYLCVISVLITTMTFATAFTMPLGGYIADDHNHRGLRYAFDAFNMANTLAFIFSAMATAGLMYSGLLNPRRRQIQLDTASYLLSMSFTSLVAVFALGAYMVLAPVTHKTAVATCVLSFLIILLYKKLDFIWTHLILLPPLCTRRGRIWALGYTANLIMRNMVYEYSPLIFIFGWAACKTRFHPKIQAAAQAPATAPLQA